MEFIDGTVVNVALPNLQTSLAATGAQAQWVVEAYALFISSLLLIGGSLGDRFGLRRTFLCGVVLFTLASIWCGLSPGIEQLLIGRCLQGIGGALLVPNSLAMLSAYFQGTERGRAIGTWSGFASIMTAFGPVLGGWMVQHGSWRAVFFLNVPIALVTSWIILTKTRNRETRVERRRLDLPGALLATAGLSCVTFGLLEWSSQRMLSRLCGAVGLLLLLLFVLVESTDARAARSHGAFSKPELRRGQSPDIVSIWCPFCNAVLSSSKPHSGSALFPNSGWRCNLADGSVDVPALPLGWWSCGAIRTAKAPHHRPSCHGRRLCSFRSSGSWRIVLDNILPGGTHVGIRDDRQRGTADDSCHEFSDPESCWRRIRNQQCRIADSCAVGHRRERTNLFCILPHCVAQSDENCRCFTTCGPTTSRTAKATRRNQNGRPEGQGSNRPRIC